MRHTRRNQHQAEPTPGRTTSPQLHCSRPRGPKINTSNQPAPGYSTRPAENNRDQQTVFPENQKKPKPTNRAKKSTIWLRIVQPPTAEDNSSLKKHSDRMVMDFAQCVVRHATKEII